MQQTTNLYELKKIQTSFPNVKITSSHVCADFIRQFYGDDMEVFESAFILLLNANHNTIGYAKISQGGVVATTVDVRIIAKYAIESLATSIILAHNHPSGSLRPSRADEQITEIAKNALKLFDIKVDDHIILSAEGYYSFADEFMI